MLSRKDIARMIGESVNLIRHNEQKLGLDRAKVQINSRVVRYNETRARVALKARGILA